MKSLATTALFLAATPAFAHTGAHMHPHGLETSWAVTIAAVAILATLGALGTIAWRRR